MVFALLFARDVVGRNALSSTIGRLFEGLSDIAKAVLIILVADTVRGGRGGRAAPGAEGQRRDEKDGGRLEWRREADGREAARAIAKLSQLVVVGRSILPLLAPLPRPPPQMLGYHSEEGWTGLIDIVLGHYGIEVEEKDIVLFVGIIPIAIDVMFKYWIFIGLNKISPGAVVTIKQLDRH
jgi:hypothetical protein